jgi:hypothetical protein
MIRGLVKLSFLLVFTMVLGHAQAQNSTQQKVDQMIEKKAEYHKLTNGEMDGYRIKIHFGVDKEAARAVRTKFSAKFNEYSTYEDYQQPNFVVLVGDFKTKLEAFEALKKIQVEFANAFIVKGKVRAKV